ncbi:MAG TPA: hypothetical protein VK081_06520 [Planctomycetota bacterium]|nr:hypothetical protein [Planctomycetota bacterium]
MKTLTCPRVALLAAIGLLAFPLGAQPPGPTPRMLACATSEPSEAARAADAFTRSVLRGVEVARTVRRAADALRWHRKLEDAARTARAEGKPIVWVQALGELRGYT